MRGSFLVSKIGKNGKIGEDNGMPSLPNVPTQVTLKENVGFPVGL